MTPQKVTESRGDCFQTEKIDFSVEKYVFMMFFARGRSASEVEQENLTSGFELPEKMAHFPKLKF